MPRLQGPLQERNKRLQALAATMSGTQSARALAIQKMLVDKHPDVLVIHEQVAPVPESKPQLMRILRGR